MFNFPRMPVFGNPQTMGNGFGGGVMQQPQQQVDPDHVNMLLSAGQFQRPFSFGQFHHRNGPGVGIPFQQMQQPPSFGMNNRLARMMVG